MKRIFLFAVIIFLMFTSFIPVNAAADYDEDRSEISSQLDDVLSEYDIDWRYDDISGLGFGELWETVSGSLADKLKAPARLLASLLAITIFTAVMRGMGDGVFSKGSNSGLYNMVCVLTAVTVITPSLFAVYESALSAIERTGGFMLVFVPVFAGITIASGGIASGGIYNMMILGASELFAGLTDSFLMPILSVTAVLAVSGSVFPNVSVESIVKLIKKLITWGMTVAMTLFTGFTTMKCTLAAKTDGAAAKTAKFIISGFVPIVGGAVSDAYSTVRGSFDVIRSTVGTAGNIAILIFVVPPLIELLVFRGVMWIGTAAAELLSADSLVRLMKGIDSGLAIAQSVLVCYSVMLILCTGILVQSFS